MEGTARAKAQRYKYMWGCDKTQTRWQGVSGGSEIIKSTTVPWIWIICMAPANQFISRLSFLGHSFYDPASLVHLSGSSSLCLTQVHIANIRLLFLVLSSEEAKDTVYGKSQHGKYAGLVPVGSFLHLEYPSDWSSQILPRERGSGCPGPPGYFLFVFLTDKRIWESPVQLIWMNSRWEGKKKERIHLLCLWNRNNVQMSSSTLRCNI